MVRRFIQQYDGGDCFFITPVAIGASAAVMEGLGSSMAPFEALRAATLEPARYFGMLDSLGTVEAGKLADLVVLDANPLQDIRNTRRIFAVVANGRLYARAERERLLHVANPSP